MGLEQRLSLRLSQRLVMTPSLQQAIKLLQMTRLELEGVLTQELVENPVLEENEDEPIEQVAPDRDETAADQVAADELNASENGELDHKESMNEVDLEAYFNDYWESSTEPYQREDRELPPLENSLTREPDLYDHLLWQLRMAADVTPRQREIAELIIGNLNPDGFLVASLDEIREMGDGGPEPYTSAEVTAALALVRTFDPPGVACANLRESLLQQLIARDEEAAPLARRVVEECWEAFLKRQFPLVAKQLGIELPDLEPAVELIKCLDTRPGRAHLNDRTHYVEPDVVVVKVGDEYVVQLNDDGLPRLRISRAYRKMLAQMRAEGRQNDAQVFIKEKMRAALWLIKSLDQRQRTIYKVASSIIRQQQEFLDHGIEMLRPMVLRDVAEDIGMHESTVSRVVSNKYMHTPRGLFPLKFFFHSGIDREYGEDISSLTVKRKIKSLVEVENPRKPLSDSDLMKVLNREGINIARRTVAKYREELNIPSSNDRRQVF